MMRFALVAVAFAAAALGIGWGIGRLRLAGRTQTPVADRGAMLFQVHCASCHGSDGRGDGPASVAMLTPPRDFASRPWRFSPSLDSIRRVTTEGIPPSIMPAYGGSLSAADLDALVGHVHRLATQDSTANKKHSSLEGAGFADLRGIAPPPLKLIDAKGRGVTLNDHRGRLVLLHFWGIGCAHCIKEVPALLELEKSNAGKLAILHICSDDDDPAVAQAILDRVAPGAVALVDSDGLGLARFEVHSLPTVWLIGADGKAIARSSGTRDWQAPAITSLIQRHLPE